MSISGITSAFAAYAKGITSAASSSPNTIAAAVQEASESRATTVKEAQRGDPVAKRKLQQLEAKQQSSARAAPSEPGKGASVDHSA